MEDQVAKLSQLGYNYKINDLSSRLGLEENNLLVYANTILNSGFGEFSYHEKTNLFGMLDAIKNYTPISMAITNSADQKLFVPWVGDKRYELSNHLGNVLAVVNDKKIPGLIDNKLSYFNADVLSYSDYYPFGMLVPNRYGNSTAYRYGFQGQEKDDELKGEGNSYNFTYRMDDPRVGRFFAIDPLRDKYPHYSPYSFSGNKVIAHVELEGLEDSWVVKNNAIIHLTGPRIGGYDSVTAAYAARNKAQSKHRYPQGTPMLSVNNRTPTQQAEINQKVRKEQFEADMYSDPEKMVSAGIFIGFKEAPPIITGEVVLSEVKMAYSAYKVSRQARITVEAAEIFNSVDNGAYHGMEFLDDGIAFVKDPIEVQSSKIGNLVDDVFQLKAEHIIEGSDNSVHNWEALVPDKDPDKIKEIVKTVLENGTDVPYKRGQAKSMNIMANGVTREVQVPYFKGADGSVENFSSAFVK